MFEILATRELAEGVIRITAGKKVLGVLPMTVHCYRVGSTLVDAGAPNQARELMAHLEGVEHVILTHHHEDHVGAAARLAEQGATVHAPEPALAPLADPPKKEPYQDRVWGLAQPVHPRPLGKHLDTPDLSLEVHPVPGHSPDHVALFDPARGWLFAGDAYLPPRDTLRADEDLDGFLDGLHRMGTLGPDRILPGHGSIVEEPAEAIGAVIDHFEGLREQARKLHARGASPTRVRRKLLGFEGPIRYYTGGHYSKQNLVDQLLGQAKP